MLTVKNVAVMNIENAMRSARNPMNSWNRYDSVVDAEGNCILGPNDLDLACRLVNAGPDHRKFIRQIFVCMDITAPMYWWKEYDTYKVATTASSTSTMHKIHSKPFSLDDFSCEYMNEESMKAFETFIAFMETQRLRYMETKDKSDWYSLIQLLPSSYHQTRTVTFDYETARNMYNARKNHKLEEWHQLCRVFEEQLPYAKEFIIADNK